MFQASGTQNLAVGAARALLTATRRGARLDRHAAGRPWNIRSRTLAMLPSVNGYQRFGRIEAAGRYHGVYRHTWCAHDTADRLIRPAADTLDCAPLPNCRARETKQVAVKFFCRLRFDNTAFVRYNAWSCYPALYAWGDEGGESPPRKKTVCMPVESRTGNIGEPAIPAKGCGASL